MRNVEKVITKRIREILHERDIRQSHLAEKANIPQGYLNELMNLSPRKRWNADHMERISEALNIPVWMLFVDPVSILSQEDWRLLTSYRNLPPGLKNAVDLILFTQNTQDVDKFRAINESIENHDKLLNKKQSPE